jgi:hypothetical protein
VIRCLGEPSFSGDVEDEGVAGILQNRSTLVSDKFVSINSYLKMMLYVIFHMGLTFSLQDAQIFAALFLIQKNFERLSG